MMVTDDGVLGQISPFEPFFTLVQLRPYPDTPFSTTYTTHIPPFVNFSSTGTVSYIYLT